jgi:SAM-dependent methyltransferase
MKHHERLPRLLPNWVKERVEVNVYKLKRFVTEAAERTPPGARVLDAGAGDGRFTGLFAHTRYVSVDLAVGDTRWDFTQLDALCNLTALPFACDQFDVVLCTQVLEHVREPLEVLSNIQRVLRPGGRLYLSVPQSWHQHQKPYDYFRYTSFGLRHLFERSGLCVASIEPMGGYFWFLSFQLQNLNYWLFSQRPNGRAWYTWPLRGALGFMFQLVIPLCLFYLDPLDVVKDETFGYLCAAVKPGAPC